MDIFPVEPEMALATAAAFALGWITQRWLLARREQHRIELLNEQIGKLEQQRDAAHRVALDLAARHSELRGERREAELMVLSLKSDLGRGYARNDTVVEGYDVHVSEMNEASWPLLETVQ